MSNCQVVSSGKDVAKVYLVLNSETTSGKVEAEVLVSCTVLEQTRKASRRVQQLLRARTLYVFQKLLSMRSLKPRELQLAGVWSRDVERLCTRHRGTKLLPPSTTRAAGFAASTNISNASMPCHWAMVFAKSTERTEPGGPCKVSFNARAWGQKSHSRVRSKCLGWSREVPWAPDRFFRQF